MQFSKIEMTNYANNIELNIILCLNITSAAHSKLLIMKSLYTVVLLLCFTVVANAQQEALIRHYQLNPFVVNPAIAGTTNSWGSNQLVRVGYRTHWNAFPGAPKTVYASYQQQIFDNVGLGALLYTDRIANIRRIGVKAAFAYQLKFKNNMTLGMGIAGKMENYQLDSKELLGLVDQSDDAVLNAINGSNTFDVDFGIFVNHKKFYAGISATNLIESNISSEQNLDLVAQFYRQFMGIVGYRHKTKKVLLEPSVLLRQVQGAPFDYEAHLRVGFLEDQVFAGVGYGGSKAGSFLVGCRFDKKITVAYSFDHYFENIHDSNFSSHEITLGYDFGKQKKKKKKK